MQGWRRVASNVNVAARSAAMSSLQCSIAGVVVEARVLTEESAPQMPSQGVPFMLNTHVAPDLVLQEVATAPRGPPLGTVQGVSVWLEGDTGVFQRRQGVGGHPVPLGNSLNTLWRVCLACHLGRRGEMLLHSSGWLGEGGALVFFGKSGAGKSTTVRRAPDAQYMCDETIGLRRVGLDWWAHSTPFSGSGDRRQTRPKQGRLLAACSLVKAPGAGWVRTLDKSEALRRLMDCAMLHVNHAGAVRGLFEACNALVDGNRVVEIGLPLGGDPWPLWHAYQQSEKRH